MECTECRRELDYGADVLSVQEGVIGPRGVVPVDEPLLFCSEECLRAYFDVGETVSMKRKIP